MQIYSIRKHINMPGYKIKKVISFTDEAIHIQVEPYKRNKGVCSGCGQKHDKVHSIKGMVAEDLRLGKQRVFLYIPKRRYVCEETGRICTERISWIELGARVTKELAKRIYELTAITSNQEAGWYMGMNDEKVYRVDKAVLEKLFRERLAVTPRSKNISVDEVAWLKWHRYVTNVVDTDEKVVTWNEKGRKAKVLDKYYDSIGAEGCSSIETASMDGAKTYISSTEKKAKNAMIVLDKFHIIKKTNETVDKVRREELRKARENKDEQLIMLANCKQRFILLKKNKSLTKRQSVILSTLCKINQPIYRGMLLKESFLQTYECENIEQAREHLYEWIDQALFSGLEPFFELACSVLNKVEYILNWFKKKISSAISEGFNNKIKRLKRIAYGYRDIEYFKLKIHQHCGYLNPRRFNLNLQPK